MSGNPSGCRTRRFRGTRLRTLCKLHQAPGTRLQWASFDERIAPLAQSRNVHVDPVIPPVESPRIVAEIRFFAFGQRRAQPLHVHRLEIMIVVQNEWLEE